MARSGRENNPATMGRNVGKWAASAGPSGAGPNKRIRNGGVGTAIPSSPTAAAKAGMDSVKNSRR